MHDANTLRSLIDLYKRHKLPIAAEHSRYRYDHTLALFAEFLNREPMLSDLRDDIVGECIGWIIRCKNLSPATASKFRDCLCAAWRFGARKRIEGINGEPDVIEVAETKRAPIAWTRDELSKLWRYLQRMPGELCGIAASDWFCSLHAALYDTGERVGAILQVQWTDIDLQAGWIVVKAETRKGRLSDKLSKLHPTTCELLQRIQWPERKLVWPWPYNRPYLWRVYGDIIKRAGLPGGRSRKFHCLRKSCATHLTALGGNAQEALGHSDGRTTRDHYIDQRQSGHRFPSDILPRMGDDEEDGTAGAGVLAPRPPNRPPPRAA